jgi:hypothetical protein
MAREDIRLEVVGDIQAYAKAVGKIPGVTEEEAEKAAKRFVKSQQRAQIRAALEAEKAAKEASKSWAKEGAAAAKGFGAVFGAAITGLSTVGVFVDQIAEARLEIDGLSRATGIGLDTLSGLKTAAELAGLEFDDVAGGLEDFGEKMFDASRGSGAALEAFEMLGFSQEDLAGRLDDTDGVLREVIEGMQGTEDAALRNTIAQQLWGDSGNRLAQALGEVPLDEFIDKADTLGNEVTPENIEAARAWKANLETLKGELVATGSALTESLNVVPKVEKATLGFVFLKNAITAAIRETVENVREQVGGLAALFRGDFAEAGRLFKEGFDVAESLRSAKSETFETTKAFFDLREKAKEVGTASSATKTELRQLSEEKDKSRKASEDLARAEAKLAQDQEKAAKSLRDLTRSLEADTLTAEEEVLAARTRNLEKIGETQDELLRLLRTGVDVAKEIEAAQLAATAAQERAERDLAKVRAEEAEERKRLAQEVADEEKRLDDERREREAILRQERVDATMEALDLVAQFQEIAFGALVELNRRAQDSTREALDEQKAANRELREERASLKEQLLEDIDEEERAMIQARLNELDAELEAGKEKRKDRRESAMAAWNAGRALAISDVIFQTSAAVMKAFALFGPPPSPVGIASAAAAGTAGAVQSALILSEKPPQFHDGFDGSFPVFTSGPDETNAVLRRSESVLNSRAADNVGRENIQRLNSTGDLGGAGGGGRVGLFFDGRQIDEVLVRTLDRGGRARRRIGDLSGSRPSGQVSVFSASR